MIRILAVTLCLTFTVIADAECNQFRGDRFGHAPIALPQDWSAEQNVLWRTAIDGDGWSSPVIAGQRLYLTAAVAVDDSDKPDRQLMLLAFDTRSGKRVVESKVFVQTGSTAPKIHGKNSHASPTPIIDKGKIYVHFGHQGTACLDMEGNVVWKRIIEYPPVHGNGGSPVLVDWLLIFSIDSGKDANVVALDAATGKDVWKTSRKSTATKKFSFSTPLVIEVDGRKLVVSPGSDVVCAYDAKSGIEAWRVKYDGYSVIPQPVYANGLVYVCTGYNRPSLLAIKPTGSGDVTETHVAWKTSTAVPHTPSLLLVNKELYMVSDRGIASCLDAETGEVHWKERVGGNFSASPVYAEGLIYLQDEQGKTTIIKASTKYEVVTKNDLKERTLASYGIGDKGLFIRTAKALYRIGRSQ